MREEMIGRGTWYDAMAEKVLDRERRLGRSLKKVRTEMGIGASGFPHIGSLGDAARSYSVTLALRQMGFDILTIYTRVYVQSWEKVTIPVFFAKGFRATR